MKMKATKKIVAAACALVAATALAAGSTFAWFATNNEVSATGLKMEVNTASSFLIIGNSTQNSMTLIKQTNGGDKTTTFQTASSKLTPVAHENTLTSANIEASAADDSPWFTQIADDAGASESTGTKTKVAYAATYVLADTLYVSVKSGSGDSDPLHVGSVTVTGTTTLSGSQTVKPVSVILVCGTNVVEYKCSGTTWDPVDNKTLLADVVKDSEVDTDLVKVNVYVYYDGEHADVYTNNATNLVGATISVTMQAVAATGD